MQINVIYHIIQIVSLSSLSDSELSLSVMDNVVGVVEKAKLLDMDLGLKLCSLFTNCRILGKFNHFLSCNMN